MRGRRLATWAIVPLVLARQRFRRPHRRALRPSRPTSRPGRTSCGRQPTASALADPGDGEQAVAVAAGPVGFAAVGYRESGSSREGLAWFSADGHTWTRIEAPETFAGIEMLDVTAAPNGFAALDDDPPRCCGAPHAAVFRSADGTRWERVDDVPGADDTYPTWLTGGADGVVATGTDAEGRPSSGAPQTAGPSTGGSSTSR